MTVFAWVFVSFACAASSQCQRAILVPVDGAAGDLFADAVSVERGRACISADLDDDNGVNSGSAYIFESVPSGEWQQIAKIKPDDGAPGDEFSRGAVALDGDRLLIGALLDDDRGDRSGSAYVFERDANGIWFQTAKLLASDGDRDDSFGSAAALQGDTAFVGAEGRDGGGAVYVFRVTGGVWRETQRLTTSSTFRFGRVLAISSDVLVVGAPFETEEEPYQGAAHVFERDESGRWVHRARLLAADPHPGDQFGRSVAIDGGIIAVGSEHDHRRRNPGGAGAAYVFERDQNGQWVQTAELLSEEDRPLDSLGNTVAVDGERVLSGAPGADIQNLNDNAGAVYVFERAGPGGEWVQTGKFTGSRMRPGQQFGIALATHDGVALVGAPRDDINGPDSGAAYIFELERCGDIDGDGDVDLDDHARFHECLSGPFGGVRAICTSADLDRDDDVDLSDYRFLQPSLSGPS
jgi:hypothetical protein